MCTARFVIQGHTDRDRNMLVHSSVNIKQQKIRTILCISAMLKHRLWSQDVSQAYLQSFSLLRRDVCVQPKHGFPLQSGQSLKFFKPLYGLTDSGNYWHDTMKQHLKGDLNMNQTTDDLACFTKARKCNSYIFAGISVEKQQNDYVVKLKFLTID